MRSIQTKSISILIALVMMLTVFGTATAEQERRKINTPADADEWIAVFLGEHPEDLEGKLRAGDPLPSMRNLAAELRISFMTTKRAYEELEQSGFVESFTGKGSFVKAKDHQLFREEQLRRVEAALSEACEQARKAGVTSRELHEMLDMINGGDFQ